MKINYICIFYFVFNFFPLFIFSFPQPDKIVHGCIAIQKNENQIKITQKCPKAVIDWLDFSLQENEKAIFIQNPDFAVLNRVISDKISKIYGSIEASGKFYLINQAGILIGPKGSISANEIILSTLDLSKEEFILNKELHFRSDKNGKIQNFGNIKAINSDIFILSKNVENFKDISAEKGNINLIGSSDILILDSKKDIIIKPTFDGSVTNEGNIKAIQAKLKSSNNNLDSFAINQKGIIEATGFYKKEGRVILCSEKGVVSNEGNIIARNEDDTGGNIQLLGERVHLLDGSNVDTSARYGGGEILVGGDYQGKNQNIQNAKKVFVENEAIIKADTMEKGDGGRVILWSDESMAFFGNIFARGGINGGNGGFVEISSGKYLRCPGNVNLTAPIGNCGTLFLDPYNLTISTSATLPDRWTGCDPNRYDADADTDNIQDIDINTKLTSANVIITTGTGGTENGVITVQTGANVNWNTSNYLTMEANNWITIETGATINSEGTGAITLTNYAARTDLDYHGIVIEGTVQSDIGKITLNGKASQRTLDPPSDNFGVYVSGGILSSGSGNIDINAQGGQKTYFSTYNTGTISSISGDISFITNMYIQFDTAVSGGGNVIFKARTPEIDVYVAGEGGLNTNSITATSLDQLSSGFSSIIFGDLVNTNNVVVANAYAFDNPVKLIGDSVTINGELSTTGINDVTIQTDCLTVNSTITGSGDLTIYPKTAGTSIGLGMGAVGDLTLDVTALANLTDGFNLITFGDNSNTSIVNIEDSTYYDNLVVIGDTINVNGAITNIDNTVNLKIGQGSNPGFLTLGNIVTASDLTLNGGLNNDTFTFNVNPVVCTTINGVTGTNNYYINACDLNISTITAGIGADNFIFAGGCSVIGTLNFTNGGTNSLDYSAYISNIEINLETPASTTGIGGITCIANLTSVTANTQVTSKIYGMNTGHTWNIMPASNGMITGEINASFTNFTNLVGGIGNDTFVVDSLFDVEALDGGGGNNTLQLTTGSYTWTIDGSGSSLASGSVTETSTFTFDRMQNLVGSTGLNTFWINTGGVISTIVSGNGDNIYKINGGDVSTSIITGTGDDIFEFSDGKSLTVASGVIFNTPNVEKIHKLDYCAYNSAIYINLSNETITDGVVVDTMNSYSTTGFNSGASNTLVNISSTTINDLCANPAQNNELVGFNSVWEITGVFSGTIDGVPYAGLPNITGTNNADTFNFSSNGTQINVRGIGGNDTFNFGYDGTIPGPVNWTGNVNNLLQGGNGDDVFVFWGDYQISATLDGQGGTNELRGPAVSGINTTTFWVISGINSGTIQPVGAGAPSNFSNINRLIGSDRDDSFDVTLASGQVLWIDGSTGTNDITGPNSSNIWTIGSAPLPAGNDRGTLQIALSPNLISFVNIQKVIGRTNADDFRFGGVYSLTGTPGINGNGGVNIITGAAGQTNKMILTTSDNAGNILIGGAATTSFINIQKFVGGTTGTNILEGRNFTNVFTIDSVNQGNINASNLLFSNVQNLEGNAQNDIFMFNDASITGYVEGKANTGGAGNIIDTTFSVNPLSIYMAGGGGIIGGGLTNIQTIQGGNGLETLYGRNENTTWNITGTNNGNFVNATDGTVNFIQIDSLVGGNANDTFRINPSVPPIASINSGINGGGGLNSLIVTTGVDNTWNITSNNAGNVFPVGGSVTSFINIQNLTGSIGTQDIFILASNVGVSGYIDGGACGEDNLLDYSAYTTVVNVFPDCPGGAGTATNILGGISHIDSYIPPIIIPSCPLLLNKAYLSELLITYDLKRFCEFNTYLKRYYLIYINILKLKNEKIKFKPEFEDKFFKGWKMDWKHFQN